MRMALPALEPGEYEVRWTTFSTEDGELARGTYAFTVVAGSPATVSPSSSPRPTPSEVAPRSDAPTMTPAPGHEPENGPETGGDEVIWPLLVLAIMVAGVGVWIYRRP